VGAAVPAGGNGDIAGSSPDSRPALAAPSVKACHMLRSRPGCWWPGARRWHGLPALIILVYAAAVYLFFLAVLGYAVGFFAGFGVPKGIDQGPRAAVPVAAGIDLPLLLLFAVQHTVMARPWFKRRWARVVPEPAERASFVLAATVTLRRPPPLDTPMAVERDSESTVRIHHGPTLIAEATSSPGIPGLQHRSDSPARGAKRPAGGAPKGPLRHRSRPGHSHGGHPMASAVLTAGARDVPGCRRGVSRCG
jgi:hypothetical protein